MANSQILVAITGVVCSGKSFLGKIIAKLGYKVFSCDDEIHDLLKQMAIIKRIGAEFPEVMCNATSPFASSSRKRGPRNQQSPAGIHFNKDLAMRENYIFLGSRLRALLSGKRSPKSIKASPPLASSQRKLGSRPNPSESWEPSSVFKSSSLGQAQGLGLDPSFRWDDAKGGHSKVDDSFRTVVRLREDDENMGVNRKLLAEIVFKDKKARQRLEDILYPKLFARQDKFIAMLRRTKTEIGFFEVPLLYEKKLESHYDYVIVTKATKSILKKRAIERNIDLKVFSNILKAQGASDEKEAMADYVVDTNMSAQRLQKSIEAIIKEILECQSGK